MRIETIESLSGRVVTIGWLDHDFVANQNISSNRVLSFIAIISL